jgi:hypothetical protein
MYWIACSTSGSSGNGGVGRGWEIGAGELWTVLADDAIDVLLIDAGHKFAGLKGDLDLATLVRLDCLGALALNQT